MAPLKRGTRSGCRRPSFTAVQSRPCASVRCVGVMRFGSLCGTRRGPCRIPARGRSAATKRSRIASNSAELGTCTLSMVLAWV